jgi:hypothetical protein
MHHLSLDGDGGALLLECLEHGRAGGELRLEAIGAGELLRSEELLLLELGGNSIGLEEGHFLCRR